MSPKFFDIHTHVSFAAYDNDRDEVMERAKEVGVAMINVGTGRDTSRSAVELAEKYPEQAYATVGLHPIHTEPSYHDTKEMLINNPEGELFNPDYYRELAQSEKVVAIGECGLDYFRLDESSKKKQFEAFEAQIALANELGKPLMLHIRNAYRDAYDLLKKNANVKGNVHFFAGTWEEAQWFLDSGFTVSFTGVITFARDYDETIKNAPLEQILSETDAPYVAPVPYRGKRNEPAYVSEVVKKIAEIRGKAFEKVRETLVENARRMFLSHPTPKI